MTGCLNHGSPGRRIFSQDPGIGESTISLPMGRRCKVLLGDEQGVLRDGLAALLTDRDLTDVVGSTGDGSECLRLGLREQPDLLIFDTAMRGLCGTEVARRMARHSPRTRLLCLSARAEPRWIRAAFDAGAHGYVLKRNVTQVLMDAVDAVMRFSGYISADIAHVLVDGFRTGGQSGASPALELSSREREVTRLYAEGLPTREIADKLCLSMKTIGTHRDHIMAKLNIRGIAQLTRYALREGLIPMDA